MSIQKLQQYKDNNYCTFNQHKKEIFLFLFAPLALLANFVLRKTEFASK